MRTKYRFLHRAGGWYHWESVRPVSPGDSRHEHVTCPVAWFWGTAPSGFRTYRQITMRPRHEHRDHVQVARDGTRCWCGIRHEY